MNRFVTSILILMFQLQLTGQMFTLSDQYLNNTLAFNPAYAGSQDALSASIIYRNQWIGFEDAPQNSMFSVHAPLRNDRIGLGLMLENSSYGINRETGINSSYSYRMELQNGILAFGIGFGLTVRYAAWSDLIAADEGDMLLINNQESAVLPDISMGIYYHTSTCFFGFSIPMLLSYESNTNTGKYKVSNDFGEYNYFIEGGYFIGLSDNIKLLPSVLIKYYPGHTPQADFNAQLILKERLWIGAGYRSRNTLLGMLQCQLNRQLMAAYSYSFDIGSVGKISSGSHEVVLNYLFSYSRKVAGPRKY